MFCIKAMAVTVITFISCLSIGINYTNKEKDAALLKNINAEISEIQTCQVKPLDETKKLMEALNSKEFLEAFHKAVEVKKSWEISLNLQLLDETLKEDSKLYNGKDYEMFRTRRNTAKKFNDPNLWSEFIFRAFHEVVCDSEGEAIAELRKSGLYNPFYDFVEHVNYFETVKRVMDKRGERVYIFGNNYSSIHDIDKIHPVMLVAYAEKFDDHKDTLLWKKCVQNHIDINYHHQGNPLWKKDGECCERLKYVALGEMICDKVSRRLQKNMNGKFDETVWDVEEKYFDGLPPTWLSKVSKILSELKK